jgi:hypothetical protein
MAVYLVSDERIDVLALVSVRRGSKPPLPAGQTSSRRHCSRQIVRKKSNCGPQQPSAADHRISVLSLQRHLSAGINDTRRPPKARVFVALQRIELASSQVIPQACLSL